MTATVAVITAGVYFKLEKGEWLWITFAISSVMVAEAFNTAIEKLTDLVSPGYNKLAGETKDLAAGAVLISSLFAVITGVIIFYPKIIIAFL